MEKENIIDLGKIKVPESWDEVTLKQLSEIERYYSDADKIDIRNIMHILINKDMDYVNQLPMSFTELILEKLMFLQEKPSVAASPKIEIDGEVYSINAQEKLKTGEYISIDAVIKADKYNYASILAVLCRKEGEIYDSKFENEVLPERIKMFEGLSVVKAYGLISFFLNLYLVSHLPTLLSSELREEINLIRKSIETSVTNGEVSKRSTKSAMKTLKKLEKTINGI